MTGGELSALARRAQAGDGSARHELLVELYGAVRKHVYLVLGDHVAVVAAPETVYRVVRADAAGTELAIDRGIVTARLWHTEQPHRLALSGGGVTAIATGTIYSLAVGSAGPVVSVIEGTVEVRASDGVHVVHAGTRWPPADGASGTAASRALLALAAPPPMIVEDAVVTIHDAPAIPPDAADAAIDAPPEVHVVPPDAPAIKDRWRTARLLRGQGRFTAALAECLAIVDARDPTWSPIALVEAIRIELEPLADPERAIALADRMVREWPSDALASEARELRCRALRQLGRAEECTPATPP